MVKQWSIIFIVVGALLVSGCATPPPAEHVETPLDTGDLPDWTRAGSIINTNGLSSIIGYGQAASKLDAVEQAEQDVVRQLLLYIGMDVASASVSRSDAARSSFLRMRSKGYVDGLNVRSHISGTGVGYSAYLLAEVGKDDLENMRQERRKEYERTLSKRLDLAQAAQREMQQSMLAGETPSSAFATGEFQASIKTSLADAEQSARNGARLVALQQLSATLFGQSITAASSTDGVRLNSQTQGAFRSVELGTWVWREENTFFARVDIVGFREDLNDGQD